MTQNNKKDWYLGLDIGTNSVGFSATDTEYNILTKNGKLQCGSRLFEGAKDASERRGFRSSRRRLARRKVRIDLLQELFDQSITGKDQSFFIRLNESFLHLEDKELKEKYPLFNDKDFTDKEYYKKFPTIYHLRKHLLENDETDVRLLYLACHHLIKYRGHFLFSNFSTERSGSGFKEIIEKINAQLSEQPNVEVSFTIPDDVCISNIIKDGSKSYAKQWLDIKGKLNPDNDKLLNNIFTTIQGNKISLSKIFNDDENLKEQEKELGDKLKDFKFSHEKYDECFVAVESILNDYQLGFLELLKQFYGLVQLDRVMMGHSSFSKAMVVRYEEHKADLKLLKKFFKDNLPDKYNEMFRKNINYKNKGSIHASYVNYVGSNITHGEKDISHFTKCVTKGKESTTATHEDFLKYVGSIIEEVKDKEGYQTLKDKIENKTLCKIHNTQDNSYIPYQLNKNELEKILEKQKNNFKFLSLKDNYGTITEKIISLLTFRIPYYVGPLSNKDKNFAWVERKDNSTKITPWNFKEIIDTSASGENFITRMTAKCTYLRTEDVIPKQSLLYQKYMLLNDLNNLKINSNRITQELKMFLYNGICQSELSLSKKKIKDYLVEQGKIDKSTAIGKENENDEAFNSSLSSLVKFKNILGENMNEEMCENIIKWHTIFGDEKEPVREKIKNVYEKLLSEEQIKKLTQLSFKGWAKFSARFLNEISATDKSTGEMSLTIMRVLEETTSNLMEILNSDGYSPKFMEIIKKENIIEEDAKVDHDMVKDLYCSPTVKRSIWQSILISKELSKINCCPPKKVFIEVTRVEDKNKKGKMTTTRRKQIADFFNKIKDLDAELKEEFEEKKDEKDFRSDRLYFYFTQLGKCMYTGEKINLSELYTNSMYDIDHIYPQSKIKDDSLTNRVLVKRKDNADKSDSYPINSAIQKEMKDFWSLLKSKNLINTEKYERLTCKDTLTQEIIGGFINRQLVSTNQAVKETAKVLEVLFGNKTKIVYSKAGNVSEFRKKYELIKCREINNLHHAHDAYLNIIVGNVWDSIFSKYWETNSTFNEDRAIDKLFEKNHEDIWKINYIEKIKGYLFDNKKYLNKYPVTTRSYEVKGVFYDQTIHPKGEGQFELKEGLETSKYGGYKSGYNAYNCVIDYDEEKNERTKGVFSAPVRFVGRYKNDELLTQIIKEKEIKIEIKNPKLVRRKIQMFSVLEVDGVCYHMRSGDMQCSATTEWYPDKEIIQIIHDIFKYKKLVKTKAITADTETKEDIEFRHNSITCENNLKVYDAIIEQVKKPFYANYNFAKKVKEGKIHREKFKGLKTFEQVEQLVKLLNVITINGTLCDASKIGGVANETCKYNVGNNINKYNITLISQSVTGLFEKRIVLNKKV